MTGQPSPAFEKAMMPFQYPARQLSIISTGQVTVVVAPVPAEMNETIDGQIVPFQSLRQR